MFCKASKFQKTNSELYEYVLYVLANRWNPLLHGPWVSYMYDTKFQTKKMYLKTYESISVA